MEDSTISAKEENTTQESSEAVITPEQPKELQQDESPSEVRDREIAEKAEEVYSFPELYNLLRSELEGDVVGQIEQILAPVRRGEVDIDEVRWRGVVPRTLKRRVKDLWKMDSIRAQLRVLLDDAQIGEARRALLAKYKPELIDLRIDNLQEARDLVARLENVTNPAQFEEEIEAYYNQVQSHDAQVARATGQGGEPLFVKENEQGDTVSMTTDEAKRQIFLDKLEDNNLGKAAANESASEQKGSNQERQEEALRQIAEALENVNNLDEAIDALKDLDFNFVILINGEDFDREKLIELLQNLRQSPDSQSASRDFFATPFAREILGYPDGPAIFRGIARAVALHEYGADSSEGGEDEPTEDGDAGTTEGGEDEPTEGGEDEPTEDGDAGTTEDGSTPPPIPEQPRKNLSELRAELNTARDAFARAGRRRDLAEKASKGKNKNNPVVQQELKQARFGYDRDLAEYQERKVQLYNFMRQYGVNAEEGSTTREGQEMFAKQEAYNEVFLDERAKLNEARAQEFPGLERKGFEKFKSWAGTTSGRVVITTLFLGAAGATGIGVAMWAGSTAAAAFGPVMASLGLSVTAGWATRGLVGLIGDPSPEQRENDVRRLGPLVDDNGGAMNLPRLSEIEAMVQDIDLTFEQKQKVVNRYKAVLGLGASFATGLLSPFILDSLSSGVGGSTPPPVVEVPPAPEPVWVGGESAATPLTDILTPTVSPVESIPMPEIPVVEAPVATVIESAAPTVADTVVHAAQPAVEPLNPGLGDWFPEVHDTSFNKLSPLDSAKAFFGDKIANAGIIGTSGGEAVPSPLVNNAITEAFGAHNMQAWDAAARATSDPKFLEFLAKIQQDVLANPGNASKASEAIAGAVQHVMNVIGGR